MDWTGFFPATFNYEGSLTYHTDASNLVNSKCSDERSWHDSQLTQEVLQKHLSAVVTRVNIQPTPQSDVSKCHIAGHGKKENILGIDESFYIPRSVDNDEHSDSLRFGSQAHKLTNR